MKSIVQIFLILVLFILFSGNLLSQTSEAKTASSFSRSGSGTTWSNEGDADSSDDAYAMAVGLIGGGTTEFLEVEDFNFTVPVGATVNGIEVLIEKNSSAANSASDANVQLLKGGVPVGNDASKGGFWGTTDANYVYGSSTDLWGATWEANEINVSGFGVSIQANAEAGLFPNIRVDFVQITVHYTVFPIELLSFDAQSIKNLVSLEWITASETNNDYFQLERSKDNFAWEVISNIDGAGTTSSFRDYNYLDEKPNEGTNFYRLKNVDYSGAYDYSSVIQVEVDFQQLDIHLQVNSLEHAIQIEFVSPSQYPISGVIYDISGREIIKVDGLPQEKIILPITAFTSGVYYLKARNYKGSVGTAFSIP